MRRTRASTAASSASTALPATRPATADAEVVTIDDDDGEQVLDVQLQPQQGDSRKENTPIASSASAASDCSSRSLFDEYRFKATDDAAETTKAAALPFPSKKRSRSTSANPARTTKSTKLSTAAPASQLPNRATKPSFPPTMRHRALPPLLPNLSLGQPPPTLLIVGSAPSEASLAAQCYYAYRHNHFWPITARLFGFDAALPYAARVAALADCGVAVWDVCSEFSRKGSLDSNLRGVVANDFVALFDSWPSIRVVASNGGTSGALFRKHVGLGEVERRGMRHVVLPSSSPAHAMKNAVEEKTRRWRDILQIGENGQSLLAVEGSNVQQHAVEEAEQGDLVEIED